MIRILVADDHTLIREGFKKILKEESDLSVVREARNAREVLETARHEKLDIILLDLAFPDRSGLDVLKDLKQLHPKLPVLILSMHPEERFAIRAIKAGAAGYITKESAADELVKAIRKILGGGTYISATLAEQLAEQLRDPGDSLPHTTLSDREFEVLCLLASGKTVGEIAEKLSLSVKTISTYRARILDKMNMRTNAEMIHYALQHRLVE